MWLGDEQNKSADEPAWLSSIWSRLSSLWPVAAIAAGVIVLTQLSENFGDKELSGIKTRKTNRRKFPSEKAIRAAFKMGHR